MKLNLIFGLVYGMIFGFTLPYIIMYIYPQQKFIFNDSQHHSNLESTSDPEGTVDSHHRNEIFHHFVNSSVADQLFKEVRVLCWVMTAPYNFAKKAKVVKETWGKRCTILVFMSSKEDNTLPVIKLPSVTGGRNYLWAKTKESLKYIYKHYIDLADWFLKADDDTYVILENLRYMLKSYKWMEPLYFGFRYKQFMKQGYMSGGAGYVLSKEALRRFVKDGVSDKNKCRTGHGGNEDVEIGKCLEQVGVFAVDTRDPDGRGKFFPLKPEAHLKPVLKDPHFWFWKYTYYNFNQGMNCCSNFAISFHEITPNRLYLLEYLIYHLRPFGIPNKIVELSNNNSGQRTHANIHNKKSFITSALLKP